MGTLLHLLRSPYWWWFLLVETTLVSGALGAQLVGTSIARPVSFVLLALACALYALLSAGLLTSESLRKQLVRPEALFDYRDKLDLMISGGTALALLAAAIVSLLLAGHPSHP